jgi:hypothetical protein
MSECKHGTPNWLEDCKECEEEKEGEPLEREVKPTDIWICFAIYAGFFFVCFIIHCLHGDEAWFSRLTLSVFCQAIAAILWMMGKRV